VLEVSGASLFARSTGRAFAIAAAGDARDSVAVSVVPVGTLIADNRLSSSGDVPALFSFGLDGSGYHQLARIGGWNNHGLRWSPVLNRLVLHDTFPPTNLGLTGLYSLALDGAEQLLLPPMMVTSGLGAGTFASTAYPSATSDGGSIYFTGTTTTGGTSIWRIQSDGTGAVRVSPLSESTNTEPTVSPDGRHLVYVSDQGNFASGQTHLMLLDLTTGASLSMAVHGDHPVWSPNSDEIAYFANGVSVIRSDGTGETVVAAGNYFDTFDAQIEWSPDGKWLVTCATGTLIGAREIVLLNRATGELLPLAFTAKDKLCEATWKR
jgi:Tol biopolymer transport system component